MLNSVGIWIGSKGKKPGRAPEHVQHPDTKNWGQAPAALASSAQAVQGLGSATSVFGSNRFMCMRSFRALVCVRWSSGKAHRLSRSGRWFKLPQLALFFCVQNARPTPRGLWCFCPWFHSAQAPRSSEQQGQEQSPPKRFCLAPGFWCTCS